MNNHPSPPSSHSPNKRRFESWDMQRLVVAITIGTLAGIVCAFILGQATGAAGDFTWALRAARDMLAGQDVYARPFGEDLVPYPLPAALVALPLVAFADPVAAGLFFGSSTALFVWCVLRSRQHWRLLMIVSWPFCYGLVFAQWPPLVICVAFLSSLLPLLLVKPQIAIPILVFHRFRWYGVGLLVAVGLLSLAVYPTWPLVWLNQIRGYKGTTPLLISLPFGPLLLLALLRWRSRYVWFFLLYALMPQRVVYDQLGLLLLARSRRELAVLVACSWITLPAILFFGGWLHLPGGWQNWIILTLYVPALVVLRHPPAYRSPLFVPFAEHSPHS